MNSFIIYLIILFFTNDLFSETITNGRHYNYKEDGLELRTSPDNSSKILTIIPYGGRVDLEKELNPPDFSINGIKGKFRLGSFKKAIGYVFDGYLSKYPTPLGRCETLKDYADESFKKQNTIIRNDETFKGFTTNYIGGVKLSVGKIQNQRIQKLELKHASFKDVFFIAKTCSHPAFRMIEYPKSKEEIIFEIQDMKEQKIKLIIKQEEDNYVITEISSRSEK